MLNDYSKVLWSTAGVKTIQSMGEVVYELQTLRHNPLFLLAHCLLLLVALCPLLSAHLVFG